MAYSYTYLNVRAKSDGRVGVWHDEVEMIWKPADGEDEDDGDHHFDHLETEGETMIQV